MGDAGAIKRRAGKTRAGKTLALAGAGVAAVLFATLGSAPPGRKAIQTHRATLRFEVRLPHGATDSRLSGRLFVVMSRQAGENPRFSIGRMGLEANPVLAVDVRELRPGRSVIVDRSATAFPIPALDGLPAGEYTVQAVLRTNRDLRSLDAAGNLFSRPVRIHLTSAQAEPVELTLTETIGPEKLPADTPNVRYVRMQSALLSRFWGRPIFLRAGVVLPRGYESEPDRRYPLWVRIGGFGTRYTRAGAVMGETSGFRRMWMADDTPRFLVLQLDGDGPLGDPYQVNSANDGPYGDAVTRELILYVEQKFRGVGTAGSRFVEGGSTGGWVSLALQVFYPDFFNGCWSISPDPVDFRAYELIDIYGDRNAYTNRYGFERPSMRTTGGDTQFTVRHECQLENLLGAGDSYTTSGGQWGVWNAVFGRRAADGRPAPLWKAATGEIDPREAAEWRRYDLRIYLEENWKTLAPKLQGKIRIWVGDADNYFLNDAVHLLDASLAHADPPFEGMIKYGPGKGHTWCDLDDRQILQQMEAAYLHSGGYQPR